MHHEILLQSRPGGSDQDILNGYQCPGCQTPQTLVLDIRAHRPIARLFARTAETVGIELRS